MKVKVAVLVILGTLVLMSACSRSSGSKYPDKYVCQPNPPAKLCKTQEWYDEWKQYKALADKIANKQKAFDESMKDDRELVTGKGDILGRQVTPGYQWSEKDLAEIPLPTPQAATPTPAATPAPETPKK